MSELQCIDNVITSPERLAKYFQFSYKNNKKTDNNINKNIDKLFFDNNHLVSPTRKMIYLCTAIVDLGCFNGSLIYINSINQITYWPFKVTHMVIPKCCG